MAAQLLVKYTIWLNIPTTGFVQSRGAKIVLSWLNICLKVTDHRSHLCKSRSKAVIMRTQENISPNLRDQRPTDLEMWTKNQRDMSVPGETQQKFSFALTFLACRWQKFAHLSWERTLSNESRHPQRNFFTKNKEKNQTKNKTHSYMQKYSPPAAIKSKVCGPSCQSSVARACRKNKKIPAYLWFHHEERIHEENPNDCAFHFQAARLCSAQGRQALSPHFPSFPLQFRSGVLSQVVLQGLCEKFLNRAKNTKEGI